MIRTRIHGGRAGSSLLELLVALALMGTTIGALLALGGQSTRLFETGTAHATLESSARRGLERIARELHGARSGSLQALPEAPLWQELVDFDALGSMRARDGRITWTATRAGFRHEPGELDDGLDNDGDGLVDEGQLVLVQDPGGAGERVLVLASGVRELLEGEVENGLDDNGNGLVDERGVSFARVGQDVRLHLTLEDRDRDGRTITRTLETSAWPRN